MHTLQSYEYVNPANIIATALTVAVSRALQQEDIAPLRRDGNIERSFYFNLEKTRAATPG
ncbi:hypothetical protein DLM46_00010 [Paraburkholderia lacunae]|uniref:Uncharacterized protein n=1 Tax=Paraburkholderia lacunae TaxID=2211104 RepID=A0A370NFC6_9BURK|nr:hypothetical protein DLM46_00010 [Paraburkholderia lacunae]